MKKIYIIVTLISLSFSIYYFFILKQNIIIEKTSKNYEGKWTFKNETAEVLVKNKNTYAIKYENSNFKIDFDTNVLNVKMKEINLDLLYLKIIKSECLYPIKIKEIILQIKERSDNKIILKFVSTNDLEYIINNMETNEDIKKQFKNMKIILNIFPESQNKYNEINYIFEKTKN